MSERSTQLVCPRSFAAHYGSAHRRTLVLGGGGLFFVAWQVAYLQGLAKRGVVLADASLVVGTSAGSMIAAIVTSGGMRRFAAQIAALARFPAVINALAPADELTVSQERALDMFRTAQDSTPETLAAIGHAALAADTPPQRSLRRSAGLMIASRKWPSPALRITSVDAYTGERLIFSQRSDVPVATAAAASSSVPGLFAPQLIHDRFCMDGGVSGSGTHTDLVAGAEKALVVSLSESFVAQGVSREGGMTQASGAYLAEMEALRAAGTRVFARGPETVNMDELMKPSSVPGALAMGDRQASADAQAVSEFWND